MRDNHVISKANQNPSLRSVVWTLGREACGSQAVVIEIGSTDPRLGPWPSPRETLAGQRVVGRHKTKTGRGWRGESQLWHCCLSPVDRLRPWAPTPPISLLVWGVCHCRLRARSDCVWAWSREEHGVRAPGAWARVGGCLVCAPRKSGIFRGKSSLQWARTCPKARTVQGPADIRAAGRRPILGCKLEHHVQPGSGAPLPSRSHSRLWPGPE